MVKATTEAAVIEIEMVKQKETKGTFMYEEALEDGNERRPMNIYLPKNIVKAEFGAAVPERIVVSITRAANVD